ncbi:MAG: hypothetical protein ACOYXW_11945 [Actinomycetota bacterium]
MPEHSRRTFLVTTGAAAVTLGGLSGLAVATTRDATHAPATLEDPAAQLVAYVSNATTGEITLMRGDHETVVRDRSLAATLVRLAR